MKKINRVRVLDDIRAEENTLVWGDESDEDAEVVEVVVDQRRKFPGLPELQPRVYRQVGTAAYQSNVQEVQAAAYRNMMDNRPMRPYAARQNTMNLGRGKDRPAYPRTRWMMKRKLI